MRKLEILKHNMRTINLLNQLITFILIVLLIAKLIFQYIIQVTHNPVSFMGYHYIIVIVFNIVLYYIMNVRKLNFTREKINKLELLLNIYVTAMIVMGAYISLHDTSNHNPLLVYTFIQLICSSFLVLNFYQIFIPITLSQSLLIIGLYFMNGIDEIFYMQVFYLFSIALMSFLLVYFNRKTFLRSIQYQVEMKREAKNNRELTKKLREANRKLELQLLHDPLTNLFNRRAYNEYVLDLQNRVKEKFQTISVIMLDVDCFKQYNDTYGHFEGDNVLMKIADTLQNISERYNCFVARWGGEEFSVLVANQSPKITDEICQNIMKKVKELKIEHNSSNVENYVTVSIGAYTKLAKTPKDITDCINFADEMLYQAKENGRNNFYHKDEVTIVN